MKKLLSVLVLILILFLPVNLTAYAADEDEDSFFTLTAFDYYDFDMFTPNWTFCFKPTYNYKHHFLWFDWGKDGIRSYDINYVNFLFYLEDEEREKFYDENELLELGCKSEFEVMFEYVFDSVDDSGEHYKTTGEVAIPFTEFNYNFGYEIKLDYASIINCSEYGALGYPTVIKSFEVYLYHPDTGECGNIYHFDFYCDEDYSLQVYNDIDISFITEDDIKFICDDVCYDYSICDDGVHLYSDYPLSNFEEDFKENVENVVEDVWDLINAILFDVPKAIWRVLKFIFSLFIMLPVWIHKLLPFVPESVITFLMFVFVLGIVVGIYKIFKE